ncbi:MAG: hypothetical protein C0169_07025, partial [Thermodesulfobacterium geofontis]
MVLTEKDYLIKVVNYKGKITEKIKFPKTKKEKFNFLINLLRLYERAKKYHFLTKDLFLTIKKLAEISKEAGFHITLFKNPVLVKHFLEILDASPENLEEEIVYGKVRERETEICHVCGCNLVYPAYIVYKQGNQEVKKSNSIGIKCLNSLEQTLKDLIEEIEINY